jgi:hypothetical protein
MRLCTISGQVFIFIYICFYLCGTGNKNFGLKKYRPLEKGFRINIIWDICAHDRCKIPVCTVL